MINQSRQLIHNGQIRQQQNNHISKLSPNQQKLEDHHFSNAHPQKPFKMQLFNEDNYEEQIITQPILVYEVLNNSKILEQDEKNHQKNSNIIDEKTLNNIAQSQLKIQTPYTMIRQLKIIEINNKNVTKNDLLDKLQIGEDEKQQKQKFQQDINFDDLSKKTINNNQNQKKLNKEQNNIDQNAQNSHSYIILNDSSFFSQGSQSIDNNEDQFSPNRIRRQRIRQRRLACLKLKSIQESKQNLITQGTKKQEQKGNITSSYSQVSIQQQCNNSHSVLQIQQVKDNQSKQQDLTHQNDSSNIKLTDSPLKSNNLHVSFLPIRPNMRFRCKFKREKSCALSFRHPRYSIYTNDQTFVINAKKQFGNINSFYHISKENQVFEKNENYLGFVQGNFFGTLFNIYSSSSNNQMAQLIATVYYEPQFTCKTKFRSLQVYILANSFQRQYERTQIRHSNLKYQYQQSISSNSNRIIKLTNKKPQWSEKYQHYFMNFGGKSKYPSIKNLILINQSEPHKNTMMFCKQGPTEYYLQICHPLSMFLSIAILVTSFDFKLICQ